MKLLHFLKDPNVWFAQAMLLWQLSPEQVVDFGLKVLFGLPAAMYMAFKTYNEFIKKKPKDDESE